MLRWLDGMCVFSGMDPKLWMAAKNPNKKAEENDDCIQMLLECLLMLCTRRLIREELRKRKVYFIVRNYNYSLPQVNEKFDTLILDIVNFLQREDIALNNKAEIEKEREILEDELSVRNIVDNSNAR